jgi:hypothetical protein
LRERHFAGTNLKPRKVLENAQTPRRRVHALLGSFDASQIDFFAVCLIFVDILVETQYITETIFDNRISRGDKSEFFRSGSIGTVL